MKKKSNKILIKIITGIILLFFIGSNSYLYAISWADLERMGYVIDQETRDRFDRDWGNGAERWLQERMAYEAGTGELSPASQFFLFSNFLLSNLNIRNPFTNQPNANWMLPQQAFNREDIKKFNKLTNKEPLRPEDYTRIEEIVIEVFSKVLNLDPKEVKEILDTFKQNHQEQYIEFIKKVEEIVETEGKLCQSCLNKILTALVTTFGKEETKEVFSKSPLDLLNIGITLYEIGGYRGFHTFISELSSKLGVNKDELLNNLKILFKDNPFEISSLLTILKDKGIDTIVNSLKNMASIFGEELIRQLITQHPNEAVKIAGLFIEVGISKFNMWIDDLAKVLELDRGIILDKFKELIRNNPELVDDILGLIKDNQLDLTKISELLGKDVLKNMFNTLKLNEFIEKITIFQNYADTYKELRKGLMELFSFTQEEIDLIFSKMWGAGLKYILSLNPDEVVKNLEDMYSLFKLDPKEVKYAFIGNDNIYYAIISSLKLNEIGIEVFNNWIDRITEELELNKEEIIDGFKDMLKINSRGMYDTLIIMSEIGIDNIVKYMKTLSSLFGKDYIYEAIETYPDILMKAIKIFSEMDKNGIKFEDYIKVLSDSLNINSKDIISFFKDKTIKELTNFLESIQNITPEELKSYIEELKKIGFQEDTLKKKFISSPCDFIKICTFIFEKMGRDYFIEYMNILQKIGVSKEKIFDIEFLNTINQYNITPENLRLYIEEFSEFWGEKRTVELFNYNPSNTLKCLYYFHQLGKDNFLKFLNDIAEPMGLHYTLLYVLKNTLSPYDIMHLLEVLSEIGINKAATYIKDLSEVFGEEELRKMFIRDQPSFARLLKKLDELGGIDNLVARICSNPYYALTEEDAKEGLRLVGIYSIMRFYPEDLAEIIRNRISTAPDNRPIAVVIANKDDWNGGFNYHHNMYRQLIQEGYRVMYYEVSTDREAIDALLEATQDRPASVIIFGGHGNRDHIWFGNGWDDSSTFDFSDYRELLEAGVSSRLVPDGVVILIACSTGEGQRGLPNMANMFAEIFPQAKGIFAPIEASNIYSINFYNHEIIDVLFIGRKIDYNAAQFIYIVQRGDTLWDIAKEFNIPIEQLIEFNMKLNPNFNPDLLYPGQEIVVPPADFDYE